LDWGAIRATGDHDGHRDRLEQWRRRRDRADGLLISWDDLRMTRSDLIVGSGRDAQKFPLRGLSAKVDVTASPYQADEVHLIIVNADHDIRRRQPCSYGARGNAQTFAIKFNSLSGHPTRRETCPPPPPTNSSVCLCDSAGDKQTT
jgi:hypothetical protein